MANNNKKSNICDQNIATHSRQKHKRLVALTPLDLCLRKGIITSTAYGAACFFTWLYMLRYGQQVRVSNSYDACLVKLCVFPEVNKLSVERIEKYNRLFLQLQQILERSKSYNIVSNICIFGCLPSFLRQAPTDSVLGQVALLEYRLFREGLAELANFLYRKKLLPS